MSDQKRITFHLYHTNTLGYSWRGNANTLRESFLSHIRIKALRSLSIISKKDE